MSDDLVQRLRKDIHGRQTTDLLEEAADRIEELEKTCEHWFLKANDYSMRNIALEEALGPFARFIKVIDERDELPETSGIAHTFLVSELRAARRALKSKP